MSKQITVELPEDLYEGFAAAARRNGKTPEEYLLIQARVAAALPLMPAPSPALRAFAGCVSINDPRGLSNEAIDDDLAAEYGDTHESSR